MILCWHRTIALDRWVYNDDVGLEVLSHFGAPRLSLILYIGRRSINNNAYAHGMGRHTQEEVYEIMKEDLGALSAFLGKMTLMRTLLM